MRRPSFNFDAHRLVPPARRIAQLLGAAWLGLWCTRLLLPEGPLMPLAPPPPVPQPAGHWHALFDPAQNARETTLEVRGLVAGQNGQGVALLSLGGNPPRAYRSGERLAPGIRLESVSTRQAVVDRDGRRQTLVLPHPHDTPGVH